MRRRRRRQRKNEDWQRRRRDTAAASTPSAAVRGDGGGGFLLLCGQRQRCSRGGVQHGSHGGVASLPATFATLRLGPPLRQYKILGNTRPLVKYLSNHEESDPAAGHTKLFGSTTENEPNCPKTLYGHHAVIPPAMLPQLDAVLQGGVGDAGGGGARELDVVRRHVAEQAEHAAARYGGDARRSAHCWPLGVWPVIPAAAAECPEWGGGGGGQSAHGLQRSALPPGLLWRWASRTAETAWVNATTRKHSAEGCRFVGKNVPLALEIDFGRAKPGNMSFWGNAAPQEPCKGRKEGSMQLPALYTSIPFAFSSVMLDFLWSVWFEFNWDLCSVRFGLISPH
eukprot:gene6530-biopygen17911